ncbi:MAG: hypothetical protein L0H83_14450 [Salinisphaera sp.]|nr:hypothetical protein [Salinisphaera sp.]
MAITTEQRLDAYLDAEARILQGQSGNFDGDSLTLADLDVVRKEITRLQRQVSAEQRIAAGGGRARVALADFNDYDGLGRCGR